jgi:hypothetical protein
MCLSTVALLDKGPHVLLINSPGGMFGRLGPYVARLTRHNSLQFIHTELPFAS